MTEMRIISIHWVHPYPSVIRVHSCSWYSPSVVNRFHANRTDAQAPSWHRMQAPMKPSFSQKHSALAPFQLLVRYSEQFWCNYLYSTIYIIFVIYSYYIDFVFEIVWALLLSANPVNPLLEILAPSAGSNVVKRRQDVDGFTVPLPLMRSQRKNAEDV